MPVADPSLKVQHPRILGLWCFFHMAIFYGGHLPSAGILRVGPDLVEKSRSGAGEIARVIQDTARNDVHVRPDDGVAVKELKLSCHS